MPDSDDLSSRNDDLHAGVQRRNVERARYLAMLGFDWRRSPVSAVAEDDGNSWAEPHALTATLSSGRIVQIDGNYQYPVDGGVALGVPSTPERQLTSGLKAAERVFPMAGHRPCMLIPVLRAVSIRH